MKEMEISMKNKHKYLFSFVAFVVIYACIYMIRYYQVEPLQVNYYTMDEVAENAGIEYKIEGVEFYTQDELLETFALSKDLLESLDNNESENRYIVVKKKVTKLREDYDNGVNEDFYYTHLYSKHMLTGMANYATEELNEKLGKKTLEELAVNESEERYQIFHVASCNHEEELWDNYDNETYYFEISDNEYHQYVDRIRIHN